MRNRLAIGPRCLVRRASSLVEEPRFRVVAVAMVVSSCFARAVLGGERLLSETIVADRFLSGGRALASSCGLRRKGGSSCFGFLLPFFAFSFSLFLALSLIASSQFRLSLSVQSFILYHKLCSLCFSTHAHTSKRSPPSPILFMDHCARTNWHMYIKSCFFPPSSFVYAGVRCEETGRFLLLGWPVQEVLVPFSLSLSLWLCGDEARSNKKKKTQKLSQFSFPPEELSTCMVFGRQ